MVRDGLYLPEGGEVAGGQTSPAALWVTSTCLEEAALSQVDVDNNNKINK